MTVYSHFALNTLSNTYLVGLASGKALLIDPGVFDGELLELIEHHGYELTCVLLTHANPKHLDGLRTLSRVYTEARICAAMPSVLDLKAREIKPGQHLTICGCDISVIGLPGQGRDSVAYLVEGFLFCGTALSAGELGSVPNSYARAILTASIADSILALPGHTVILPFFGPPTTVAVENRSLPLKPVRDPEEPE